MISINSMAEIGSLVGDPTRLLIIQALMNGRALSAKELAFAARIAPQTASGHLNKLTTAGLLSAHKHGRNRYFRLTSSRVAQLFESIGQLCIEANTAPPKQVFTGPKDAGMRRARSCYDHMAGRLGVDLADALVDHGSVELSCDGGLVTEEGEKFFASLDIELEMEALKPKCRSRVLCRPCLDWSERRFHIAGRLGTVLYQHCLQRKWVRTNDKTRALQITRCGETAFYQLFGMRVAC